MTLARAYALALVGLLLGAVVVGWAYAQAWGTVRVPSPGSDATAILAVTGQALWPLGSVAGWLAAACALGILATRGWGRTVVAAVATAAGLAAGLGGVRFAMAAGNALNEHARASQGVPAVGTPTGSAWWLLATLGGVLIMAMGIWTMVRGRTWPAMGSRYERGPRHLSAWEAQDLGQDPTDDLVE